MRKTVLLALSFIAFAIWHSPYWSLEFTRFLDGWADVPIADDAFYFLQIARHVAEGNGPTFDGLHETTGYQPLWMWTLAAVQWLFEFDGHTLVWVTAAIALLLLAFTGLQMFRFLRENSIRKDFAIGIAGAFAFSPVAAQTYLSLCEAALQSALFIVMLRYTAHWIDNKLRPFGQWSLGLCMGLFFLARIDGFFVVGALIALHVITHRKLFTAPLWRVAAPAICLGAGYGLANLAIYGHLVPISGALKSYWSGPRDWGSFAFWWSRLTDRLVWFWSDATASSALGYGRALAVLPILWIIGLYRTLRPAARIATRPQAAWTVVWVCIVATLPKHLYYSFMQGHYNDGYWYYATEYVSLWILAPLAVLHGLRSKQRTLGIVLAGICATALLWANLPGIYDVAYAIKLVDGLMVASFAATLALIAITATIALRHAPRPRLHTSIAASGIAMMIGAALVPRTIKMGQPVYASVKSEFADMGRWMHEAHLTDYGTVGAYSAGIIGYEAGGRVANLDGLVQDWEWYELCMEHYWVPPPRGETFVADYYAPLRDQLAEADYSLVFGELPRYHQDVAPAHQVYLMTNDRAAADKMLTAIVNDEQAPTHLRLHALQSAWRNDFDIPGAKFRKTNVNAPQQTGPNGWTIPVVGTAGIAVRMPELATDLQPIEVQFNDHHSTSLGPGIHLLPLPETCRAVTIGGSPTRLTVDLIHFDRS